MPTIRHPWTSNRFREEGALLVLKIAARSKRERIKAQIKVAIAAASFFRWYIKEIVRIARSRPSFRAYDPVQINVSAEQTRWHQAVDAVATELPMEIALQIVPEIHNAIRVAYRTTAETLGSVQTEQLEEAAVARATGIATRLSSVNATTKIRIAQVVNEVVSEGGTAAEVEERIQKDFNTLSKARVKVIARTETANAYNAGTITAFQQVPGLAYIDVIGCESREEDKWGDPDYQQYMYRGESTCNISNVPLADAPLLNFHPNHTGVIVPSAFVD